MEIRKKYMGSNVTSRVNLQPGGSGESHKKAGPAGDYNAGPDKENNEKSGKACSSFQFGSFEPFQKTGSDSDAWPSPDRGLAGAPCQGRSNNEW
jgi:hypothetical protein